jgi:uncharacterized iron-regulated protein
MPSLLPMSSLRYRLRYFAVIAAIVSAGAIAGTVHAAPAMAPATPACLTAAAWHAFDGEHLRTTGARELLLDMASRDVVLLGEWHNDDDHHRWQVQTLAALAALRPGMVIGFEMFPRRLQPVLERWVNGELTLEQFIVQSEWDTVWGMPFEQYLPLFQFARINRIPMLALNVGRKLIRAVAANGWDGVPPSEREGVGRALAPSKAYRDFLFDIYNQHGQHSRDESSAGETDEADSARERARAFDRFVESQTTWDRAMAEVLAQRVLAVRFSDSADASAPPLVVGIIGSGHLNHGYGVPHQLRDLGVGNTGVLLPMDVDTDCKELTPDLADAIFALPTQVKTAVAAPRLGLQIEQKDDGVLIAAIKDGSLAQQTGLQNGDHLIMLAGSPVAKAGPVRAALQAQPAGSWLPLQVLRNGLTLDLMIKFAPKP